MGDTNVIALATLFLGAAIGYVARLFEFTRDRRLAVYSELVAAFLAAARAGSVLYSAYVQLGETIRDPEHAAHLAPHWDRWANASQDFDSAITSLRLVGSARAQEAADELDKFILDNVRQVPPFAPAQDPHSWGSAAQHSPKAVGTEATALAKSFADRVRRDVTGPFQRVRS